MTKCHIFRVVTHKMFKESKKQIEGATVGREFEKKTIKKEALKDFFLMAEPPNNIFL